VESRVDFLSWLVGSVFDLVLWVIGLVIVLIVAGYHTLKRWWLRDQPPDGQAGR
jgi:hypothetical protein